MEPKTLRVRASGTALVQNYEHLEQGRNSFIGRINRERAPGEWGFEPTNETVEVPNRVEYVRALQTGCLEAADEATAKAAGLELAKPEKKAKSFGDEPKKENV